MIRSRDDLHDVLVTLLCAAAERAVPMVRDCRLGTSGVVLELVAVPDEVVGFVLCTGDDPLEAIEARLAVAARYCERVALVVDDALADAAGGVALAGAALWGIARDGRLHEHVAGRRNAVSPAAFFDLMPPGARAALLRAHIPAGAYDRGHPPLSGEQVRTAWQDGFARDAIRAAA